MEYVRFGNTGMKVSKLCLGTMTYGHPNERWPWALNEADSKPFIKKALDLGINFFDTADIYSYGASETVLGKALKEYGQRHQLVIATKVFNPMSANPNDGGLSRKHIMYSIDASLKRLQTDYVDLYQIHRWDYHTPIEETMEALHDVVKAGKARYIGASSMYTWQFAKALYTADLHGWTRFVSMQPHYNLIYREEEREMLPLCRDQKIAVIPWSPLARGLLTGRRTKERKETLRAQTDEYGKKLYQKDSDFDIVNLVSEIATAKGLPPAQIALAWVLSNPDITAPIIGASKPGHLEDAVAALSVQLSQEDINRLEALYEPHPVLGHQ
ncbi:MAG: aldo/keto reductase [Hydrotalea flava]|uniref:aldo/keto reductase n=1 Tax=Hydrotalea lipotrueae TaxID=2803817 RepID=UPI0016A14425|nr:aldo/keto reductase [Hydrotalea lipotrueae]NIM35575.1 aldo/keto reductase [Hydrotalea flava]NIM38432.1 aldo/keto reductase [Hydrotalea flava]NIN03602.1 aldo/keto reductase [Hydrotalea flava]NIN15289.1 aldo/keto reductase [Hydrotalea flava]NIO94358.1 aldo/keto reductase [Hydrotalea flava]